MSSTALPRARKSAATGLPPSWYLDTAVFEIERRELLDDGLQFVGRTAMVPRGGDYAALEGANAGWLLVNHGGEFRLVSNACRHRQAQMLHGCGNAKRIICPVHNWAYALDGRQVAAPHFPENPCLDLATAELNEWRGLLFAGPRDIAADLAELDEWPELEGERDYVLDRTEYEEHDVNWKGFMEVFLEDYHVGAVHPGFRTFVNPDDIRSPSQVVFGERFFMEKVTARWPFGAAGSAIFDEYQRLLLDVEGGKSPAFGAIWLTYFPNTLIEWYPHANIITTYDPLSPTRTRLCSQYYFRRSVHELRPDFVAASHAMFAEVTAEDHDVTVRLHDGRKALYQQGVEYQGPYQEPMEQGLRHYHQFLRAACVGA
jgi:phenylpropionate dioxygenase-like ring-hydroxylating dioxygenase large terminal subunit